jgi:pseudouridine-5'-phosphate glycosidase/pseudouridine kinase
VNLDALQTPAAETARAKRLKAEKAERYTKAQNLQNPQGGLEPKKVSDPANTNSQAAEAKSRRRSVFLEGNPSASLSRVFHVSSEIRRAVAARKPVVALESTIYTHGFPYPDNIDLALGLEQIVRDNGGIPATIGVLGGVIRVGLDKKSITELASAAHKPDTMKVSRRDIPYITGVVSNFIIRPRDR